MERIFTWWCGKGGILALFFNKYAALCSLYEAFIRIFMHFLGARGRTAAGLGLKKLGATNENGARRSILSRPSPSQILEKKVGKLSESPNLSCYRSGLSIRKEGCFRLNHPAVR